ncbi:MAG: hypothetical protein V1709_05000 [Planctomycetota bacterium]
MNNKNNKRKNPCDKYQQAITHYVLDQEMDISKEELYGHLAQCEKCQKDAREWRATTSVLRAQEYDSRPESKKRFEEFMAKLHQTPVCAITPKGEKIIDARWEFCSTAGMVYNYLKNIPDNKARVDDLVKELGLTASISGMSWLVSEDKLAMSLSGKDVYAFLHKNNKPA